LVIKGPVLPPLPNGSSRAYTGFGKEIAAAGDVNGDGRGDIVFEGAGYRYLVFGRPGASGVVDLRDLHQGVDAEGAVSFESPDPATRLVLGDLAGIGDVNGDGLDDLAVGVSRPYLNPLSSAIGHVYILYGRAEFPARIALDEAPAAADVVIPAPRMPDGFGSKISGVGDVNGDAFADFAIVGDGPLRAGELFVVYGGPDLPREIAVAAGYEGLHLSGQPTGDHFRGPAIPIGDFNGDGAADFMLEEGLLQEGPDRIFIVFGPGSGDSGPNLVRLTPRTGALRGGTRVQIRGSGFAGAPAVSFGGAPARGVRVVSRYLLEATTPPGAALGPVDVEVEIAGERRRLERGFEYAPDAPQYDLGTLGGLGLVVEGDVASSPQVRGMGFFTSSPMAFADIDGDGADELAMVSTSVVEDWLLTVVRGGEGVEGTHAAYQPSERVAILRTVAYRAGLAGASVSALGDVDGDGIEDLGIGGWLGRGWVLFGRPEGLLGDTLVEDEVDAGRATSIDLGLEHAEKLHFASLGDGDGNGRAELALGHSEGGGEIVILELGARRLDLIDDSLGPWTRLRVTNALSERTIGQDLAAAGDVDGDGVGELFFATNVVDGDGRAYLLSLGRELPAEIDVGEIAEGGYGVEISIREGFENLKVFFIAGPGDVDGDGLADLLAGVWGGGELTTQGIVYLIYGFSSLPARLELRERPQAPDGIARLLGEGPMEQAGAVGAAGDWNGDGISDFLIGAPGFQDDSQPGNVFLVYGARDFPERLELSSLGRWGLRIDGHNRPGGAGFKVGPYGDVNGDGEADFAFLEAGNLVQSQKAYVIFGPYGGRDFVRGEINLDGAIDIADAVFLLTYLFLGGEGPACADSADVDDSGALEITDAVRLLGHLFLGDAPPPPPHALAGRDPTSDALECLGF
jgi:hypothetical protein